jgi:hypothetical protein
MNEKMSKGLFETFPQRRPGNVKVCVKERKKKAKNTASKMKNGKGCERK